MEDKIDITLDDDFIAGNGIKKIEKTNTEGLLDIYTVFYTNGDIFTFTVKNGEKGEQGYTPEEIEQLLNDYSYSKEEIDEKVEENTGNININTENINANTQLINTKSDKKKTYNIEIDTDWTAQNTKTIQVQGILETDIVNIYPVWSENKETRLQEKEQYNKISLVKSGENSIELTCDEEIPTIKLNARIEVVY